MVVISFIGNIYYNMIIAWSLYYMFASFQKTLPWDGCDHDYNTQCEYIVLGKRNIVRIIIARHQLKLEHVTSAMPK